MMSAEQSGSGTPSRARWILAGGAIGGLVAVAVWVLAGTVFARSEPPTAAGPPAFVEEAQAAGIEHVYDGEFTFFVGGGVAVFDCDANGLPDLYMAGGANSAALYRNETEVGGELRFARVAAPATDLDSVVGAYPIDIDSDEVADLAVLRLGENVLLQGRGDCTFERANEKWQFDGGDEWTAGFSAQWEEAAQLPTIAFGNYLELDAAGQSTGGCSANSLLRPDAAGYSTVTPLGPGWCALSILFSDWDRSGRRDLRVTNDRHYYRDGEEQLWRVAAGESPSLYSREDGWKKMQIWGMGIASYDVTGDGIPEVFLTSQGDNKLQTLEPGATGPAYEDIAIRRGATAHRPFTGAEALPSTAWHAEFQDVNNDGFIDLFISKGNVEAMPDHAADDPNNLLLGQPDGSFVEGAEPAGILSTARSRGAALADFNLDGMLDLVEIVRRENVKLWRSVGFGDAGRPAAMGNWLAIRLEQPGANRSAIGSWIEVEAGDQALLRELTVGGGHAGGQLGWIHFGLGAADSARLRVLWPDGETGPWIDAPANRFAIVERGAPQAEQWLPPGD